MNKTQVKNLKCSECREKVDEVRGIFSEGTFYTVVAGRYQCPCGNRSRFICIEKKTQVVGKAKFQEKKRGEIQDTGTYMAQNAVVKEIERKENGQPIKVEIPEDWELHRDLVDTLESLIYKLI